MMLARAAARRQRRHSLVLAATFAQLQLKWLAPAHIRWVASRSTGSATESSKVRKRSRPQLQSPKPQSRPLATAATEQYSQNDDYLPFSNYGSGFKSLGSDGRSTWDVSQTAPMSGLKMSALRPNKEPLILNNVAVGPQPILKFAKGIQGSAVELLQHLRTCLQVGRIARAKAIILRLSKECPADSPELAHAHTAFLEAQLNSLMTLQPGEDAHSLFERMHSWFETEIVQKSGAIDAHLLVVMIRAGVIGLVGLTRDEILRDYAEMARELGSDVYKDVLCSEELSDLDFTLFSAAAGEHLDLEDPQEDNGSESMNTSDSSYVKNNSEAVLKLNSATEQFQRQDPLAADAIPDVRPTAQKGSGLVSIQKTFTRLADHPSLSASESMERQRITAHERQRIMEESSVEVALDRWRRADEELRAIGIHSAMQTKTISALMWQWYEALLPTLEKELVECRKLLDKPGKTVDDRYSYGPLLEALPVKKLAAITVMFMVSKCSGAKSKESGRWEGIFKISGATLSLANHIEQEAQIETFKRKMKRHRKSKPVDQRHLLRMSRMKARNKPNPKGGSASGLIDDLSQQEHLEWNRSAKVKFGALLIKNLLETAQLPVTREHPRSKEKITQLQPAFLHRQEFRGGKKTGIIIPHPDLIERMQVNPSGALLAKRLPMVVEPKPWTGWKEGGYVHFTSDIVRLQEGDKNQKDYFVAAHNRGDMGQIYAGLTALGKVPWKVHKGVFETQLEAWNSGKAIANFAPLHPELEYPAEPDSSATPFQKREWLDEVRRLENLRTGFHSQRCYQNFQMEVARTLVNETMYFPHNMDFRGRAYPIPPYLNHMGADNVRGLLVFAEGKELGRDGLRWLKIHLATVAGHDKASMSERVEFTETHLENIKDSATNPLGGSRWWLKSEDAWQTLAACFELTEALAAEDPTKFVSHLPIQQDGTCNGLQHYAALGGDEIGAAQVNLEPGDRPSDVYSAVLRAVEREVHLDAEAGHPSARKLDGLLTRKCVKQPVMTNVYGVTWFGAKEQVLKQLEGMNMQGSPNELRAMAQYIATKIFQSLGHMFSGAQAIQYWLGQCAERISTCLTPEQIEEFAAASSPDDVKITPKNTALRRKKEIRLTTAIPPNAAFHDGKPLFKSTVIWTTPLRLPVVQPYRASVQHVIATNLQNITLQEPRVWHPVNKRKQSSAFPPNFIHSLDATHMLLSAMKCNEVGITFASIHDSFWCHACDVDRMSVLLRDAFIAMHKENIVGRLREEFQLRYKGCVYLASVRMSSPVGREISAWRKSQGVSARNSMSQEIVLESRRLRLLDSKDPAERAEGEAMVTPGSILASEADPTVIASADEANTHRLGKIPGKGEAAQESVKATTGDAVTGNAAVEESELPESEPKAFAEAEEANGSSELTENLQTQKHDRKKPIGANMLHVWLPLTFPEVPPKGKFDVTRLSSSRYFFH